MNVSNMLFVLGIIVSLYVQKGLTKYDIQGESLINVITEDILKNDIKLNTTEAFSGFNMSYGQSNVDGISRKKAKTLHKIVTRTACRNGIRRYNRRYQHMSDQQSNNEQQSNVQKSDKPKCDVPRARRSIDTVRRIFNKRVTRTACRNGIRRNNRRHQNMSDQQSDNEQQTNQPNTGKPKCEETRARRSVDILRKRLYRRVTRNACRNGIRRYNRRYQHMADQQSNIELNSNQQKIDKPKCEIPRHKRSIDIHKENVNRRVIRSACRNGIRRNNRRHQQMSDQESNNEQQSNQQNTDKPKCEETRAKRSINSHRRNSRRRTIRLRCRNGIRGNNRTREHSLRNSRKPDRLNKKKLKCQRTLIKRSIEANEKDVKSIEHISSELTNKTFVDVIATTSCKQLKTQVPNTYIDNSTILPYRDNKTEQSSESEHSNQSRDKRLLKTPNVISPIINFTKLETNSSLKTIKVVDEASIVTNTLTDIYNHTHLNSTDDVGNQTVVKDLKGNRKDIVNWMNGLTVGFSVISIPRRKCPEGQRLHRGKCLDVY